MAHIQDPARLPAGWLWRLGWQLDNIAILFGTTAETISDVWLIGEWLATPFDNIHILFHLVANYARSADDTLMYVLSWINYFATGNAFLLFLGWSSSHFNSIISDAKAWIIDTLCGSNAIFRVFFFFPDAWLKTILAQVSSQFTSIINNPVNWVNLMMKAQAWHIGLLINDPVSWLWDRLNEAIPWFYNFITYPGNWFYNLLVYTLGTNSTILFNPLGWLLNLVLGFSQEAYNLLVYPSLSIRRYVANLFGIPESFFSNPMYYIALYTFQWFELLFETLAERFATLAIRLILRFI